MRKNLQDAFNQFAQGPFPRDSYDDIISDVHAELVEYDGYIAGLVSSYAFGNDEVKEKIVHDPTLKDRLNTRVKELPELEKEASRFLLRLQEIKKLIDLAQTL